MKLSERLKDNQHLILLGTCAGCNFLQVIEEVEELERKAKAYNQDEQALHQIEEVLHKLGHGG